MKKAAGPVARDDLLQAISQTYDDSRFLIGTTDDPSINYLNGLARNRSVYIGKGQLLQALTESSWMQFPLMPGFMDRIVLSERMFVYKQDINHSQVMPSTPDVDGFTYCQDRFHPHYDIFYRFDHDAQQITFALGNRRKTLPLGEYSGWAWKLARDRLLCSSSHLLEQAFQDPFWNPIAVAIGRKALKIKPAI